MRRFLSKMRAEIEDLEQAARQISRGLNEAEKRLVSPEFLKDLARKAGSAQAYGPGGTRGRRR